MKANSKNVVLILLLVAVFIFTAVIITDMVAEKEKFGYSDVIKMMAEDKIKSFSLDVEGYMTIIDISNKEYVFRLGYNSQVEYVHEWATNGTHQNLETYDFVQPEDRPWILEYLPYIILMLLMVGFFQEITNNITLMK